MAGSSKTRAKTSITTLGTYPELSVAEARLKAAELQIKRKLRNDTVEELAKQWLGERVDHTHRKADQVRGYVDRAIIPIWVLDASDHEPSDIAGVIRIYRDRVAKWLGANRRTTGGESASCGIQGPLRLRGCEWRDHGITGRTADHRHYGRPATGAQPSIKRR